MAGNGLPATEGLSKSGQGAQEDGVRAEGITLRPTAEQNDRCIELTERIPENTVSGPAPLFADRQDPFDPAADRGDIPVTIVEPASGWTALELDELWRYRELLFQVVWRDFSSRYRQSLIGIGWAVVRPVISMVIFTLIFGRAIGVDSDGKPYALFNFAALLPWMYFSSSLTGSTESLLSSRSLLTKVYFPRLILPLSKVLIGLVDFAIQFVILILLMAWYGVQPTWGICLLPALLLLCMISSLAVGLWFTAINVKYRDVGHAIPFLTQMWMWLTPVVYSSNEVYSSARIPSFLKLLYSLNPMVGVVDGFRWAMLGSTPPNWPMMAGSCLGVAVMLVGGLFYFRATEATFADVI